MTVRIVKLFFIPSGSTPYFGLTALDVRKSVRDGHKLEKPPHCDRYLYDIMLRCWANNPDDRPEFALLVEDLHQLLMQDTDYIDLKRFPENKYYNMVCLTEEKV